MFWRFVVGDICISSVSNTSALPPRVDYRHEKTIIGLLSKSAHRVHDPADADFFFVPAPLVRHYGYVTSHGALNHKLLVSLLSEFIDPAD